MDALGNLGPERQARKPRTVRPGTETEKVANAAEEARRDRRNDRHGNASVDYRARRLAAGPDLP